MASPLRPPPLGVISHYETPSLLGTPVVIAAGLFIPLIIVFASVRIYARILVKSWVYQDYLFSLSCLFSVIFTAFSIALCRSTPFGHHVWDIDVEEINKTFMLSMQTSAISTWPVLWLTKVTLFGFLTQVFKGSHWFKISAYVGVVATGLVFSMHTFTVMLACAPHPESNLESYINGFRKDSCSSSGGANLVIGIITGLVNCLTDVYLFAAALTLMSSLNFNVKQMRAVTVVYITGAIACFCGILSLVYRVMSWQDGDITGYQAPLNVAIITEVALSLMIPCMSSFHTIWHHYTRIEINENITAGTPSTRFPSSLSFYQTSSPTPPPEAMTSWRKTHMSVEELPFRKASLDYHRGNPSLGLRDSRMKALPCTPLPPNVPKSPKTPMTVRSMRLPIMLEFPDEECPPPPR